MDVRRASTVQRHATFIKGRDKCLWLGKPLLAPASHASGAGKRLLVAALVKMKVADDVVKQRSPIGVRHDSLHMGVDDFSTNRSMLVGRFIDDVGVRKAPGLDVKKS